MSHEQVHPLAADKPGRGDLRRRGARVAPYALRRLERDDRRPAQLRAQLAGEPRRGDDVELLADDDRVPREGHGECDSVVAERRRRGRDAPAGERAEPRRHARSGAVHGDGDGVGRDRLPPPLPGSHGPDDEVAGPIGTEPQLANRGTQRTAGSFHNHLGHFPRPDDGESGQRRQNDGDGFSRTGARAHGQRQFFARRQAPAVHARPHVGRWGTGEAGRGRVRRGAGGRLQREHQPERAAHQSLTPGSAARRAMPERSRRVCSSSWLIERRT